MGAIFLMFIGQATLSFQDGTELIVFEGNGTLMILIEITVSGRPVPVTFT